MNICILAGSKLLTHTLERNIYGNKSVPSKDIANHFSVIDQLRHMFVKMDMFMGLHACFIREFSACKLIV